MPTRTFRSVQDISPEEYTEIFERANQLREQHECGVTPTDLLAGKWVACLFQGHSTRTKALLQAACTRLGATCTSENIFDDGYSSKGLETIEEALFSYSSFADILVIRHDSLDLSTLGSALEVPVINAMCGPDEHSLAAIGRAYSIWRQTGSLSTSIVGIYGWIPASRPLKALIRLLSMFGTQVLNDPVLPEDLWPAGARRGDTYLNRAELTIGSIQGFASEIDTLFIAEGLQQRHAIPADVESQYCRRFERVGSALLHKMKPGAIVSVGMPGILPNGTSTVLPDAHSQIQHQQKGILVDWTFCTQALLCYLLEA